MRWKNEGGFLPLLESQSEVREFESTATVQADLQERLRSRLLYFILGNIGGG